MAKRKKPQAKTPKVEREVELADADRSHGSRKKIDPERQRVINERIELARQLIRENWTTGDIKRAFKEKYGIGYRSCARYLRLARKRNIEAIDRSEDEYTADSIGFWANVQREQAERIQHAKQAIARANQTLEKAQVVLDSPNASEEKQKLAMEQIKEAGRQKDDARRTIYSATQTKMNCQDRIDKICGPGKYNRVEKAEVTTQGEDVQTPAEPVSEERELELLKQMHQETMERMQKASEN